MAAVVPPVATYRLQLHPGFTFADARAIVPYLAELGVSHLYLSPILQPAEGSTHGYDVVDPDRVNTALGGEDEFRALVDAAHAHRLAILLDIVPNHMSIHGTGNRWWRDVLENGIASYYAHYFDVDWPAGDDRVTLPVLPERYGRALASGALGVVHDGAGGFAVRAGELRLPMSPRSIGRIVGRAGERCRHPELAYVGEALGSLPRSADPELRRKRHRNKAVLLARLRELAADPACRDALDAEVRALDVDRIEVDAILELQAYRLVHWTVSTDQLGYRRFFDINSLVGVRTEQADVFDAVHGRICAWLGDGTIAGVRVDHVDGLRDPAGYLACLRARAPDAWIVVEKIIAADEALPAWPVDGTTGYELADRMTLLLADPAGEAALTRTFEAYTGVAFDAAGARRVARCDVMSDALHSEVVRLVDLAARACSASPACRDFTRTEIENTLVQLLAGYPVYRTYLGDGDADGRRVVDRDRIALAAEAVRGQGGIDRDLLGFLASALAFDVASAEAQDLARAAQQLTGGIVAKGDEDTLAYRLVRLASRCEVGSDVGVLAADPATIHARLGAAPVRGLLATATHDTKRGEDVRARITALSEIPSAWDAAISRWRARAQRGWGEVAPDRTLEYLMWQTLVGAWPIDAARARAYAIKAAREARRRTSWRQPDAVFEGAVARWTETVLADVELATELERFARELAPRGNANALAQLLVKLTAPGVPDVYQGCEIADDSLVDPDNRRAIDYGARAAELARVRRIPSPPHPSDLAGAKLWTIVRTLATRRTYPAPFLAGYAPLVAAGPAADRVFAFVRGGGAITLVPRLGGVDDATTIELPPGEWQDMLSPQAWRGTVRMAGVWSRFPIALLVRA
jgi:(1->4)-alpha-D-glucan 1-alpha-D-glucosylmutase